MEKPIEKDHGEEQVETNQPQEDQSQEEESIEAELLDPSEVTDQDTDQGENQWEQEKEELLNQLARLKADFDNFRRRTQNQMTEVRQTANESLILELLPIIDQFEMALNSSDEDSPVVSGVRMIHKNLLSSLARHGLEVITSEGQEFDPNLHEAISMEDLGGEELIVKQEMQKGYKLKGRVLRPSMVEVVKQDKADDKEEDK